MRGEPWMLSGFNEEHFCLSSQGNWEFKMFVVKLVFFSFIAVNVSSTKIAVQCDEFHGFPPFSDSSPSLLADLTVELVTLETKNMLNISWAINIDASIEYLSATRIIVGGEAFHCEYNPLLDKANLTGSKKWFHFLQDASSGYELIQAANLPLPPLGSGISYKYTVITIPEPKQNVNLKTTQFPAEAVPKDEMMQSVMTLTLPVFGCVVILMILSCCYLNYKRCWANFAFPFGFKRCPTSPIAPIPVLVVYPAENPAFQRAVVALVEFLQWHCGCSVAVDIWQQGKIAELGPMRWLAEQGKTASRVLIICPQVKTSLSSSSPLTNHSLPAPPIPAAAQDLYPLVLNMLMSQAKSSKDFSKFWMVHLGEDKRSGDLAPELRACKTFCVMKDLKKLCRCLHDPRQGDNLSALILRSRAAYTEQSAVKLREAVEEINRRQPSVSEVEQLQSVATKI